MVNDFLKICNLKKVYNQNTAGEVFALNDLSFSVSKGEFVTIVGSNAAGKTSLFNAIAGSILPTSGDIILDGKSILKIPEFKRSYFISRVRQNPNDSVMISMTLAENLAIAKLKGKRAGLSKGVKKEWRNEFMTLLKPLGLGLEKRLDDKISLLSGGQKQTVALLMAVMVEPEILLLDEHTAALDPKVSAKVLEITNRIVKDSGITTLMITHNIHHAIEYGNRLILLDNGKVGFEVFEEQKEKLKVIDVVEKMENKVAEFEEDISISNKNI
jgi:putative ABC transport system ATP-binding protein